MKNALVFLAGVSLLATAAHAAVATPEHLQAWANSAASQVREEVKPVAGQGGAPVVSVKIGSGLRLSEARIVKSSGDLNVDRAAVEAAKKTKLDGHAPAALVQRRVSFAVPVAPQTLTASAATTAAK
jgi:TonB family protein